MTDRRQGRDRKGDDQTIPAATVHGDCHGRRATDDPCRPGLNSVVLGWFDEELAELAGLIEDKASGLASQVELIATLAGHGGRANLVTGDPTGYAPDTGGLARLVRDMQYHDEACQRIACLRDVAGTLRSLIDREGRIAAGDEADAALAMVDSCHLGALRRRLQAVMARSYPDERLMQPDADALPDDDDNDSVTIF
ncbi:MAG: hypothetical protein H6851_18305 [Geminicoccaceae bacterium]|nr:hypothetical protein [Geminicoccaceae bacterium]